MPRKFIPKNLRETDRTNLELAFKYRIEHNTSIRKAAQEFGVKVMTLQDAFTRSKAKSDGHTFLMPQENFNKVFNKNEEAMLCQYAIQVARLFYGMTRKEFRRLAYDYAVACKCSNIPANWHATQLANENWYYSFMQRHPNLTLKSPEGMSIARIASFNKVNVATFFTAYTSAMEKYEFTPDRIFNVDESSISTVVKPVKVLCESGQPVAAQITRERGASMTFVGIINAAGQFLPPVFIIGRKRANDEFLRGTIHGTKAIFHESGWMNGECWLQTIQHIHEKTNSTPENKILLIMDNAECHMTIGAVKYAIDNGIVIVTLPPHTTARLQPLDVSIYGPFKTCYRVMVHDYQLSHPHTPIREQQVPEMACNAWIKACTPANVLSGFRSTGIWPINRDIFTELDFFGATVCEREEPTSTTGPSMPTSTQPEPSTILLDLPEPSMSPGLPEPSMSPLPEPQELWPILSAPAPPEPAGETDAQVQATATGPSPEHVRPYPKAPARPQGKGRSRVKSCILTEDPAAIQMLMDKDEKRRKVTQKKNPQTKSAKKTAPGRSKRKQSCSYKEKDSDSDPNIQMELNDSSEYSEENFSDEPEEVNVFQQKDPEVEDYLLVELEVEEGKTKGTKVNCIAKVLGVEPLNVINVSFMRKSTKMLNTFVFPAAEDEGEVKPDQVKGVLFPPVPASTPRLQRFVRFPHSLLSYNIK